MRAEIEIAGAGRDAVVSLDGVPVPPDTIAGLDLRAAPGRPPRLELRFTVTRRTAVALADVDVVVDEATATVLRRLGWTPPAGDQDGASPAAAE